MARKTARHAHLTRHFYDGHDNGRFEWGRRVDINRQLRGEVRIFFCKSGKKVSKYFRKHANVDGDGWFWWWKEVSLISKYTSYVLLQKMKSPG